MTSGTLRTILIVGAAVAGLSVAACKATVTTNGMDNSTDANSTISFSNTTTTTNTAMSASGNAMNATATAPTNAPAMSSGNSTAP